MSEAGFTKGPWHYHAQLSGSENHRGFRVYGAYQWVFCEVQPVDEDGREGEANARLIAAAPDLLDIAETIELGLARGYTPAELLDENSPIRDRIRAAIAKALGQKEA